VTGEEWKKMVLYIILLILFGIGGYFLGRMHLI